MSNQIIKSKIPNDILFNLLNSVYKDSNYYLINKSFYKKLLYYNKLDKFLEDLKEYYYISKQYYLTREINYKRFLTIIRQICNYNNLKYTTKIKYDKSDYEIEYYIYK